MFKNSIENEYIRISNNLVDNRLQDFYKSVSMAYIPLFLGKLNTVDIQIIDRVTEYLYLVKIKKITYEEIKNILMIEDYSSYVIDEIIFIIKLILFEEHHTDWIISQIKVKTLIFFLYLCYYYTSFTFSLIKLEKYEYIAFYEKLFAYNFLDNQYLFVQFFSCLTEMNKKVI